MKRQRDWQRNLSWFVGGIVIAICVALGNLGAIYANGVPLAIANSSSPNTAAIVVAQADSSTTDQYQTAKQLYLQNCASCHIPIPPEVLPTATWKQILEYPKQHYGQSLNLINSVEVVAMWQYIRDYSRPLLEGETPPKLVTNSRYFKALHPGVDLPKPTTHQTCISCHSGAAQLDYRTLRQE